MTARPRKPSDEEVALLPCPFCGGPALLTMFTNSDWYGHWGVTCLDENDTCAAAPWVVAGRDDAATDKKHATDMWNRRAALPPPADLKARITGLEAMLCDAQAEVERMREALAYARPYLEALASLVKTDYEHAITMSAVNKVAAALSSRANTPKEGT